MKANKLKEKTTQKEIVEKEIDTNIKNEFTNIYEKELWGRGKGSGAGSRPKFNVPYITFLENFLRDNNIKSVIDFGCGDWQFSQYIDWGNVNYLGLDVVDFVIERNF